MERSRLLVVALSFALASCAPGATTEDGGSPRPNPNRITNEEIQARSQSTAFEVVQALRPNWLQQRGQQSITNPQAGQVVIYLDGARVGGPEFLRQIRAGDVASMQRLSAVEASSRFGIDHTGGAILVTTRRR